MMDAIGSLINGREAFRWISGAISRVDRSIDFCSAFLRSEALTGLLEHAPMQLTGRVLVRWRLGDFKAGASNFDAFDIAMAYGLRVYMRLDFHGKVYSLPPQGILVGSANATQSGLGMSTDANEEVCTLAGYSEANQRAIDSLYSSAIEVDQDLVEALKAIVDGTTSGEFSFSEWPHDITNRFATRRQVYVLLVDECFWSNPQWVNSQSIDGFDRNVCHDQSLLGLPALTCWTDHSRKQLTFLVAQSVAVQWLRTVLRDNNGAAYFGHLSTLLHSSISDIPSPSRKDVKGLLQNLLEWVIVMNIKDIVVDRPNHSQRVRLVD